MKTKYEVIKTDSLCEMQAVRFFLMKSWTYTDNPQKI